MNYWYAYTGESLIAGRGRVIQHVVADNTTTQDFIATAKENYKLYLKILNGISSETYSAAFIAALAIRELGEKTTEENFSSLQQILSLFVGLNIEQVAINFLNGRTVSGYQTENLAKQLAQGFSSGELLFLPRDRARLYLPQTLNKLVGIIAFLLTKSEAEHKAFNDYLRRGIPPIIDARTYAKIAGTRPALPSFSKELREEKMLRQRGCI